MPELMLPFHRVENITELDDVRICTYIYVKLNDEFVIYVGEVIGISTGPSYCKLSMSNDTEITQNTGHYYRPIGS